MTYSLKPTNLAGYVATLLTALSLGCEKDASQLEQAVQAQQTGLPVSGTVRGGRLNSPESKIEQELDLSSPEAPVKLYYEATKNPDKAKGYDLYTQISDEKEFNSFGSWVASLNNVKLIDYEITGTEKIDEKKCRVKSRIALEKNGKIITANDGYSVIFKDGKWLLADK